MALAEGAPVSVGVAEGGMAPVVSVAPVSSFPPFSSGSPISTVNFPGFAVLSGDIGVDVVGDSTIRGNPLTDAGWSNYNPALDTSIQGLEGNFALPPGLALAQAMEVATNAWETTNPYSVIEEAEAIAAEAWPGFDAGTIEDATRITEESTLVLAESADATVAAKVASLAEELGLDSLAEEVAEEYNLASEEINEEPAASELAQKNDSLADENFREEADEQSEETREDTAETDEKTELEEPKEEEQKDEEQEEEQRPPEVFPRPMVAYSTDGQRREVVTEAVTEEAVAAEKQRRGLSVHAIANTFEAKAAKSPIRVQLALVGEEEGIADIASNLRGQSAISNPVNIIAAGHAAIGRNSAVILAANGTEATKEAVAGAVGSRRNPFS